MALRTSSILLALAFAAQPFAICAASPDALESAPERHQRLEFKILQARFAKLQQIARPHDLAFALQLVDQAQALMDQQGDGIVRLPQDWAFAATDGETLDFLMLLGLADAIAREPALQGPSTATKIVTGTLGWIAKAEEARRTRRTWNPWSAPHFESSATSGQPSPALRALTWTAATGGCEARIVAGLHKLEAINGPIGREARRIFKSLGPVAWTPNDRCGPPES